MRLLYVECSEVGCSIYGAMKYYQCHPQNPQKYPNFPFHHHLPNEKQGQTDFGTCFLKCYEKGIDYQKGQGYDECSKRYYDVKASVCQLCSIFLEEIEQ